MKLRHVSAAVVVVAFSSVHSTVADMVGDSWTHACQFTTAQGNSYDLTPLANSEATLHSIDGGFEYHVSVCRNLAHVPNACSTHNTADAPFASAVQLDRRFGYCFTIGDIRQAYAEQTHESVAGHGLDVVYPGGSRCADGRPREVRIHFICAPSFDVHHPPHFVFEAHEQCHYNITWPSVHACPLSPGWFGSWGAHRFAHTQGTASQSWLGWAWGWSTTFSLLWYSALAVYICIGCTYNAWMNVADISWAAMPHRQYWESQWRWWTQFVPASAWDATKLPGVRHILAACTYALLVGARLWQAAIVATRSITRRLVSIVRRRYPSSASGSQRVRTNRDGSNFHGTTTSSSANRSGGNRDGEDDGPMWDEDDLGAASATTSSIGNGVGVSSGAARRVANKAAYGHDHDRLGTSNAVAPSINNAARTHLSTARWNGSSTSSGSSQLSTATGNTTLAESSLDAAIRQVAQTVEHDHADPELTTASSATSSASNAPTGLDHMFDFPSAADSSL